IIVVEIVGVVHQAGIIEIDCLITAGDPQLQVTGKLHFDERSAAVSARIVQDVLIVVSVHERSFESHGEVRAGREPDRSGNDVGVTIEIIERSRGGDKGVVIVTEGDDRLVQVPENGNAGSILETTVIRHVAERDFRDGILFERESIVKITPEIADEDVEGKLRSGRDENGVGVVIGMVEIKRVADANIEPKRVQLRDRPEGIQVDLRAKNEILLRCGGDEDWPGRAEENRGTVFGEINVVVVLDAHCRAEAELYRTHLQIIRDLVDRLTARFGRRFTGERGADRILRAHNSSR